jgi:hypothetical protein
MITETNEQRAFTIENRNAPKQISAREYDACITLACAIIYHVGLWMWCVCVGSEMRTMNWSCTNDWNPTRPLMLKKSSGTSTLQNDKNTVRGETKTRPRTTRWAVLSLPEGCVPPAVTSEPHSPCTS